MRVPIDRQCMLCIMASLAFFPFTSTEYIVSRILLRTSRIESEGERARTNELLPPIQGYELQGCCLVSQRLFDAKTSSTDIV